MKLFGTDVFGIFCIQIVQGILTSLTVFLTFLLGYMLTKKYSVGIIAALLIALNGFFPFLSRFLLTETLYYFTMMLFFVVFVCTMKKDKWWLHFISGILFCVSVMVRPLIIIILPFVYLPYIIEKRKQWKKFVFPILAFIAGFVIVALPWWIRNIVTMGRLILLLHRPTRYMQGLRLM
jgi:4-amino-4-deoxy-L-arabinose transferase-like glycosyltransferase